MNLNDPKFSPPKRTQSLAPAIIQLKQNPKLDEKKREHAATLIESLYLDFTQREKGDFKPVDREKVKQENAKIKVPVRAQWLATGTLLFLRLHSILLRFSPG